ncbi:Uncharacterised protein [Vibrio cholerae]|nr:Uncharacterised protein [Vibrio cholerae]CSB51905.1 Uncharacterised protein [Vibrio cholerae]CSI86252.1 Uncharacterised protein [Vibrio cholerae]
MPYPFGFFLVRFNQPFTVDPCDHGDISVAHLLCQVTHVDVSVSDHPTGVGMSKLILITVTDASFCTELMSCISY